MANCIKKLLLIMVLFLGFLSLVEAKTRWRRIPGPLLCFEAEVRISSAKGNNEEIVSSRRKPAVFTILSWEKLLENNI